MKGLDGFEILYEIIQRHPACNVLMLTASGTVESTVEARNQGAFDSLTNPINTEELSVPIEKAFREARLRQEVAEQRKQGRREDVFAHVLGKSKAMRAVFEFMRRVSAPYRGKRDGKRAGGQGHSLLTEKTSRDPTQPQERSVKATPRQATGGHSMAGTQMSFLLTAPANAA